MSAKSKDEVLQLLEAELQENLHILIDPKQKDSFSQSRIQIWKEVVKERIYLHLFDQNINKTEKK